MGYLAHEKGETIQIFDAIKATASSSVLALSEFNALNLHAVIAKAAENFIIKIQGAVAEDGDFVDLYDERGANQLTKTVNASIGFNFKGIPSHYKVIAIKNGGTTAKLTLKAQGINL